MTKETTMPITLWTKPNCGQCIALDRALDRSGVPYETRDLTDTANAAKLESFKQRGLMQAPITESPAGTFAGFHPDKVKAAVTAASAEQSNPAFSGAGVTGPSVA